MPLAVPAFTNAVDAIAQARRLGLSGETADAVARQLEALMEDAEEGPVLGSAALEGFVRFLMASPGARHPDLSLDLAGNVVASWKPGPRSKISVTFEGPGQARWVAAGLDRGAAGSGFLSSFDATGVGEPFKGWISATPVT